MRGGVLCRVAQVAFRNRGLTPGITSRVALPSLVQQDRKCSSTFVNVKPEVQKGVTVVELNKKPVNGLTLELLTELNIALEKLENDKSVRGYILTSALPVFCAGLDILEMYQPKPDRLRTFWKSFQEMAMRLHGTRLINIAAINGAAPAGGCAMSLATDYRIMTDGKAAIGLNESLLGITAPYWLVELAQYVVGNRNADKMLQLGSLFSPQEALNLGIVDEIVPQDKVLETALQQMNKWLAIPDSGRQLTKQQLRQRFLSDFQRKRQQDEDSFVGLIEKDSTQKMLGMYLEAMKKKAAK